MAIQQELGARGEELAAAFLIERGFRILHRNWRCGHCEVDLVAEKNGKPHFVEVKTRSSTQYGNPELAVNRAKVQHLFRAAAAYLRQYPHFRDFRLDILSITIRGEKIEYFFIEDVYN